MEAWKKAGKETDGILSLDVNQLVEALKEPKAILLDSRKASEYQSEHIEDAESLPLDYINETFHQLRKDKTYSNVHCAGGYRSMIFVSILRARGYRNLMDVQGGFGTLKSSGKFKVTDYVQPITEL